MAKKYYVVWKGEKTGVFDQWSTVQALTSGRADAQFMGFTSQAEAELAYQSTYTKALMKRSLEKGNGTNKPKATSSSSKPRTSPSPALNKAQADIAIYCDGACSPNPGKSGTGIAVYQQGKIAELWYGLYEANGTNNTAELNGMLYAFKLAQPYVDKGLSVEVLSDSKYSIDSITKWATGWKNKGWKKANGEPIKNPNLVKACYELYQSLKKHIVITHVKGHANIEGNELSDRMAVLGRMKQETGLVQFKEDKSIAEILAMPSG